jgi:hypothetical protein
VFSNSPCRETPKNALKKKKKKKRRYVRTFFCELAQMYVVFSGFFFCRPSDTAHSTHTAWGPSPEFLRGKDKIHCAELL